MKFLVSIVPHIPPDLPAETLSDLFRRETDAAIELIDQGALLQIHRVVGRGGNISIWEADTPETLDRILNTLPMARYISFEVTPLMKHRVQIAYDERNGK